MLVDSVSQVMINPPPLQAGEGAEEADVMGVTITVMDRLINKIFLNGKQILLPEERRYGFLKNGDGLW